MVFEGPIAILSLPLVISWERALWSGVSLKRFQQEDMWFSHEGKTILELNF